MGGFFGAVAQRDVTMDVFLVWTTIPIWARGAAA